MESWQEYHITANIDKLILKTFCNAELISTLEARGIIGQADTNALDGKQTELDKSRELYNILKTRIDGYLHLMLALKKCKQTGAFEILLSAVNKEGIKWMNVRLMNKVKDLSDIVKAHAVKILGKHLEATLKQHVYIKTVLKAQKRENAISLIRNTIPNPISHYVSRSLSRRVKIKPEFFSIKCSDIIVFSGLTRAHLTELVKPNPTTISGDQLYEITCKFILLENERHWTELRANAGKRSIHHVLYESETTSYIWQETSGNPALVRRYLVKSNFSQDHSAISESDFLKTTLSTQHRSAFCISELPGMGKSVLLANLARETVNLKPKWFVGFVPFSKVLKSLNTPRPVVKHRWHISMRAIVHYLSESRVAEEIMLTLLKSKSLNIVLFFDGFDEISSDDVEWTTQFIESLMSNSKKIKLYITARSHIRSVLENTISAVSYDILPFTENNQLEFLEKYWKSKIPDSDSWCFSEFAKTCLETFKTTMNSKDSISLGLPLQCFLLANLTLTQARITSNPELRSNSCTYTKSLSIYEMYYQFIQMQFTKLEKKTNSTIQNLRSYHTWKALELLFPKLADQYLQCTKLNKDELTIDQYSAGILIKSDENESETSDFLHRTFAEFLTAEFIVDCFMNSETTMDNELQIYVAKVLATNLLLSRQPDFKAFMKSVFRNLEISECTIEALQEKQNFRFPSLVYFVNFQTSVYSKVVPRNEIANTLLTSLSAERFFTILLCCTCQGYVDLIQLLKNVIKSGTDGFHQHRAFYENEQDMVGTGEKVHALSVLVRLAAECTTREVVEECFDLAYQCTQDNSVIMQSLSALPFTPLHSAVRRNNYDMVEFWITHGFPLNDQSLMYWIVENSYKRMDELAKIQVAELIIKHFPDIVNLSYSDVSGNQYGGPIVADNISMKLIQFLAFNGAKVDTTYNSLTFLHRATTYMSTADFYELCCYVVENKYEKQMFTEDPVTWNDLVKYILSCDKISNIIKAEHIETLLNFGVVNVNETNECGDNIILTTITDSVTEIFLVKLEKHKLNCEHRNLKGQSFLHLAAQKDNIVMASFFLIHGLDINMQDDCSKTPLLLAAESFKMATFLISKGANIWAVDENKNLVVHLAARSMKDFNEFSKFIFEKEQNITIFLQQNRANQTAMGLTRYNHNGLFSYNVHRYITKTSSWLTYVREGNIPFETINRIFDNASSFVKCTVRHGKYPEFKPLLRTTVKRDGISMADLLLSFDCSLLEMKNDLEETPILEAARKGWFDMVELLASKGANIYATDSNGQTLLHLAIKTENITFLQKSLRFLGNHWNEYVATSSIRSRRRQKLDSSNIPKNLQELFNWKTKIQKRTPLHYAIEMFELSLKTLDTFLAGGREETGTSTEPVVNLNTVDLAGDTVIYTALRKNRSLELVKYLVNRGANWKIKDRNECNVVHICMRYELVEHLEYFKTLGCEEEEVDV